MFFSPSWLSSLNVIKEATCIAEKGQQEEEKSKEMESNLSRNDAGLEFAFNDPPLLSHYRQFSAEEEKKIYGFLSVSF